MKVVFVCGNKNMTPFSEFVPLAKYLESNNISVLFVFENIVTDNILKLMIDNDLTYYLGKKKNLKVDFSNEKSLKPIKRINSFKKILKDRTPRFLQSYLKQFLNIFLEYRYFTQTDKLINHIFQIEKPDGLILYGDRVMGLTPSSIKWFKKNNKVIFDLQVASSNERFIFSELCKDSSFSTKNPLNLFFSFFFPSYKKCYEGKCVLFYPWNTIFVLWIKKMLPINPWILGQSWADKFMVFSKQSQSEVLHAYPNSKNTVIVGQFSNDKLFEVYNKKEVIRKEIILKYFGENHLEKEIIIYNVPQFYEHDIFSKQKSIDEILYILEHLSKVSDKLVLLSLHPKMSYSKYKYLDEKYKNIRILKDERLNRSLPIADYFISAFESTIVWSIICEIVPIFLDYYGFGFNLKKYQAVQVLTDKDKLDSNLENIFLKKREILEDINRDKDILPPFDGKSGERILNEIINKDGVNK